MLYADEVCTAVVNTIAEQWDTDTPPAEVVWGYALDYDEEKVKGRRVNIFPDPDGFLQSGTGTRRNDSFDHAVLIVVCERCPVNERISSQGDASAAGVAGQPKREWMTERLRWSIDLYRFMSNVRSDSEDPGIEVLEVQSTESGKIKELIPQVGEVVAQWDPTAASRGVFQAQFRIVYRELE